MVRISDAGETEDIPDNDNLGHRDRLLTLHPDLMRNIIKFLPSNSVFQSLSLAKYWASVYCMTSGIQLFEDQIGAVEFEKALDTIIKKTQELECLQQIHVQFRPNFSIKVSNWLELLKSRSLVDVNLQRSIIDLGAYTQTDIDFLLNHFWPTTIEEVGLFNLSVAMRSPLSFAHLVSLNLTCVVISSFGGEVNGVYEVILDTPSLQKWKLSNCLFCGKFKFVLKDETPLKLLQVVVRFHKTDIEFAVKAVDEGIVDVLEDSALTSQILSSIHMKTICLSKYSLEGIKVDLALKQMEYCEVLSIGTKDSIDYICLDTLLRAFPNLKTLILSDANTGRNELELIERPFCIANKNLQKLQVMCFSGRESETRAVNCLLDFAHSVNHVELCFREADGEQVDEASQILSGRVKVVVKLLC